MASLIDKERREHFEALQVQKRRTDKINQSCFLLICVIALEAVIALIVGIGSNDSHDLIYALFLTASVLCAFIGCLKRNLPLSIAAVVIYLAGFLIAKQYTYTFVLLGLCLHLIPYGGAVYANYLEHQLRQEEGYPQFDLSLEEKALQAQLKRQTADALLKQQHMAAADTDITAAVPQAAPTRTHADMDVI